MAIDVLAVANIASELQGMCDDDLRAPSDPARSPFLEHNKERVRELGEELNKIGGYPLMLSIHQSLPAHDALELQFAWDGVGEWQC